MVITRKSASSIITIDNCIVTKHYLDRFHDVKNEYAILSWLNNCKISSKPILYDDEKNEISYEYVDGHPITYKDLIIVDVIKQLSEILIKINRLDIPDNHSDLDLILCYNKCIIENWAFITIRRASECYHDVFRDDLLMGLKQVLTDLSENCQTVMYGDLHPGNIIYSNANLKIIDYELVSYGPIEYDYGRILGWLIIRYDATHYFKIETDFVIPSDDVMKKIVANIKKHTLDLNWSLIIKFVAYTICFIVESSTFPFNTIDLKNKARDTYYPICSKILIDEDCTPSETALKFIILDCM